MKAIWTSDPHFSREGLVLGHDPRVRLRAAIEHINQHHSDAGFCVISGDMVNRGALVDYQALQKALEDLKVPYLPMVGNHDDRELFKQILPLPPTCMADFVQYSVETRTGIFLFLDTQKVGSDAGELCQARRQWLKDALQNAGRAPVYIFMHHPPMRLGLPMQDTENLQNGAEFLDVITAFSCVKHLFIGHVHRSISGTVRGVPFATMRSILYQAPAPQPAWDWESFAPSSEAPNLGVLRIEESDVILQYVQFCDYAHGVPEASNPS